MFVRLQKIKKHPNQSKLFFIRFMLIVCRILQLRIIDNKFFIIYG